VADEEAERGDGGAFLGSASVMKRFSGRVREPPSRAEIVTYVWFSAGGGSDCFWNCVAILIKQNPKTMQSTV
jgi:hypothetical protein